MYQNILLKRILLSIFGIAIDPLTNTEPHRHSAFNQKQPKTDRCSARIRHSKTIVPKDGKCVYLLSSKIAVHSISTLGYI